MRLSTKAGATLIASTAIGASGCNPANLQPTMAEFSEQFGKAIEESVHEFIRDELLRKHGPIIVSSIVFASAPPGGPPALSTFCADAGWRMSISGPDSNLKRFPSVLEMPNLNVKIERER
jgi:hypothetical protein